MNLTADNGNRLLMGLAERADLIVDFTKVPIGSHVLANVGPDEPLAAAPRGWSSIQRTWINRTDHGVPGRAC